MIRVMIRAWRTPAAVLGKIFGAASLLVAVILMPACGRRGDANGEPSALNRMGGEAVAIFDFEEGYHLFETAYAVAPPKSEEWQKAVYGMAVCLWQWSPPSPERIGRAQILLEDLIEAVPDSSLSLYARLAMGRIHELRDFAGDQVNLPEARSRYREVLSLETESEIADEAVYRLAGSYIQEFEDPEKIREGVAILRQWLERRPVNPLASSMWSYLGSTYQNLLGEEAAALDAFIKADRLGLLDRATAGPFYWRTATLAYRHLHRIDVAIHFFRKIILETPKSGRAYEAQLALQEIARSHPDKQVDIPEIRLFRPVESNNHGPSD